MLLFGPQKNIFRLYFMRFIYFNLKSFIELQIVLVKPLYLFQHAFQPLSSSKREVYSEPKIFDFRLSESPQNELSRTFSSTKLSLESLILHCLRKSCHEYPRDKK